MSTNFVRAKKLLLNNLLLQHHHPQSSQFTTYFSIFSELVFRISMRTRSCSHTMAWRSAVRSGGLAGKRKLKSGTFLETLEECGNLLQKEDLSFWRHVWDLFSCLSSFWAMYKMFVILIEFYGHTTSFEPLTFNKFERGKGPGRSHLRPKRSRSPRRKKSIQGVTKLSTLRPNKNFGRSGPPKPTNVWLDTY